MRVCVLLWLVLAMSIANAVEDADRLGRLFFTPSERATLDAARIAATQPPPPPLTAREIDHLPDAAMNEGSVRLPNAVTVNGIVTRSRGPSTLWLNGAQTDGRKVQLPGLPEQGSPPVRVMRDAIEFSLDATQPAQRVKAGQTFDPARAEVRDTHADVEAP